MVDAKLPALFVDAYNKKCPSSFMKMGMRVYLCNCGQGVYPNPMRITKPQGFGLAVCCFGGDKRDRTADLLNAIQALSQLSYTPIFFSEAVSRGQLLYYTMFCGFVNPFFAFFEKFCAAKRGKAFSGVTPAAALRWRSRSGRDRQKQRPEWH